MTTDQTPAQRCTWEGCDKPATTPQLDRDGAAWATLCDAHNTELDDAIGKASPKAMMRCWIKAKGGAAAAAKGMMR